MAPGHDSDDSSGTGEKVTFSGLNKRGSLGPAGLHNMGLATNIVSSNPYSKAYHPYLTKDKSKYEDDL